jgi:hypothetical protein
VASRDVETYEQKYSDKWPPTQLTGAQTPGVYTLRLTPAYTKFEQFRIELTLLHRLPSFFLKTTIIRYVRRHTVYVTFVACNT